MFMLKHTSKLILDNRKLLHGDIDTVLGSAFRDRKSSKLSMSSDVKTKPQFISLHTSFTVLLGLQNAPGHHDVRPPD